MSQQKFELQHAAELLAQGPDRVWRLEDASHVMTDSGQAPAKRTLERWISAVPWLETSSQASEQLDELGRPAIHLVLDALVVGARKKRQAALFVKIHSLEVQNNDLQSSGAKVLVAEDGKGAKRWCLLNDETINSIRAGLAVLAGNKPTTFFPSGEVVSSCRELKDKGIDLQFEIAIAQFSEATPSSENDLPEKSTTMTSQPTKLSHLDRLEAESLYIIREVMAHAENPVMLYSVGKDSAVMLHLARKAFYPSPPPFPLMHVDTRWKFQAMYDFRDIMAKESKMDLIVHTNPEGIEKNINPFDHGSALHTDIMKTQGLKQALDLHGFDVAFGGARRDEEKSRAKERIFSFRNSSHRWDPKNQRPELWNLYNCRKSPGESVRVFPLSNWTELDIWQYIYR